MPVSAGSCLDTDPLLDRLPVACFVADDDGTLQWRNRKWTDTFGSEPDDVRSLAGIDLAAADDFDAVVDMRTTDGRNRPFLLQMNRAGLQRQWVGTCVAHGEAPADRSRDLLLRVENTLRTLREPNAILRTVSETIGVHLAVNRAGYSEVDASEQNFVVEHTNWSDGVMPDSTGVYPLDSFGPEIIAALRRGEIFVMEDVDRETRLSSEHRQAYRALGIVSLITKPLRRGGRLVAIMTVNQDRPRSWTGSEIKLVDEMAERTWATLARARAEADLARSQEALHQTEKLTALGSLLAGVSHELNNPLSVVVGQSLMLEQSSEGTDFAERAGKIRRAAERCARIVHTFLALARQKRPQRAKVDVNEAVVAALDLVDYGLTSSGIEVSLDLADGLGSIVIDPDHFHQVLANLLINAQQALDHAKGDRRLSIRTSADSGLLTIDIRDNGPGVPAAVRSRIFEPFFTTKPQGAGTGLGLSFSHGVITAHGGTIELLEGDGTCFRLRLPVGAETSPGSPGLEPDRKPRLRGRALVVDDERDIAETMAELLVQHGFEVDLAHDGAEAMRHIGARGYDLVISDVRMPTVGGLALYDWVRRTHPDLAGRFAFATGDMLRLDPGERVDGSSVPHIEKPFTPAALARLIDLVAKGRNDHRD